MPICSYLVIPNEDRDDVAGRLADVPGCMAVPAENRDLIVLVTDTDSPEAELALREAVEAVPGVQSMVLTFGEIDPDTEEADPMAAVKRKRRRLPMAHQVGTQPEPPVRT